MMKKETKNLFGPIKTTVKNLLKKGQNKKDFSY